MLEYLVGGLVVLLVISVVGHARWHRYRRHGFGPRALLHRLLRRIDATPAQEKVFRDEVMALFEAARGLRQAWREARVDLAGALRDEALDQQKLEAVFRRHDELVVALRRRLSDGLGRVHATLDAGQRQELAALLERGHRAMC